MNALMTFEIIVNSFFSTENILLYSMHLDMLVELNRKRIWESGFWIFCFAKTKANDKWVRQNNVTVEETINLKTPNLPKHMQTTVFLSGLFSFEIKFCFCFKLINFSYFFIQLIPV